MRFDGKKLQRGHAAGGRKAVEEMRWRMLKPWKGVLRMRGSADGRKRSWETGAPLEGPCRRLGLADSH